MGQPVAAPAEARREQSQGERDGAGHVHCSPGDDVAGVRSQLVVEAQAQGLIACGRRHLSDHGSIPEHLPPADALKRRLGGRHDRWRAERVRATPDLPNAFRRPFGPGWALVGDAGLVMDPITGQGIADAFRDADLLSDALEAALTGRAAMTATMAGYERARNRAARPMFEFTTQLARLAPPRPAEQRLFAALAEQPAEVERFFGVLAGAIPQREFSTPRNLVRLVGVRGAARLMLDKARSNKPLRRPEEPKVASRGDRTGSAAHPAGPRSSAAIPR